METQTLLPGFVLPETLPGGDDSSIPAPVGLSESTPGSLHEELARFTAFGTSTVSSDIAWQASEGVTRTTPCYLNEFWTARQRAAHSLHEISYRACFKPQLPRFFIERLSRPGDVVYDPFMGRGTTLLEAALLGRTPFGTDLNPLSQTLIRPRLNPPSLEEVRTRLETIPLRTGEPGPEALLTFYHPETLEEICGLRRFILEHQADGNLEPVDEWIAMVALNRLTGHSPGFFSVYTMPPNQAVSVESQRKINERRHQVPPRRRVADLILRKSKSLLMDCTPALRRQLAGLSEGAMTLTADATATPDIPNGSVALAVTSPPFLNIVNYALDNWLRCWFLGGDAKAVQLTTPSRVEIWQAVMTRVFLELKRVVRPGGHVAFEVGEVKNGTVQLETAVLPAGLAAGLEPELVLINAQDFTKTANCWGVDNNTKGTNTNRVVLFRRTVVGKR